MKVISFCGALKLDELDKIVTSYEDMPNWVRHKILDFNRQNTTNEQLIEDSHHMSEEEWIQSYGFVMMAAGQLRERYNDIQRLLIKIKNQESLLNPFYKESVKKMFGSELKPEHIKRYMSTLQLFENAPPHLREIFDEGLKGVQKTYEHFLSFILYYSGE